MDLLDIATAKQYDVDFEMACTQSMKTTAEGILANYENDPTANPDHVAALHLRMEQGIDWLTDAQWDIEYAVSYYAFGMMVVGDGDVEYNKSNWDAACDKYRDGQYAFMQTTFFFNQAITHAQFAYGEFYYVATHCYNP